jgi:hypothetical protein
MFTTFAGAMEAALSQLRTELQPLFSLYSNAGNAYEKEELLERIRSNQAKQIAVMDFLSGCIR